jgi:hypothetical protein
MTHGKCEKCRVVWKWSGRPLLREAHCPTCKTPLVRTAARLVKNMPIKEGVGFMQFDHYLVRLGRV